MTTENKLQLPHRMLTLEFKAKLTPEQEELANSWLPGLRTIWNIGLHALEEFDRFTGYYDKATKTYNPCCPIQFEYRYYWLDDNQCIVDRPSKTDKAKLERITAPYSSIVSDRTTRFIKKDCKEVRNVTTKDAVGRAKDPANICYTVATLGYVQGWRNTDSNLTGYSCPLPQQYLEPKIKTPNYFGLSPLTNKENLVNFPSLLNIPSRFRYGVLTSLDTAWQEYDKSRKKQGKILRGKPRYKRVRTDEITTLLTPSAKECVIPYDNDYLKVVGLGKIKVRGLNRRWKNQDGTAPKVSVFKLIKRANEWFIQLTAMKQKSLRLRKGTVKATALDPGLNSWSMTDEGISYENPRYYRAMEERLALLQQDLAHKLTHKLILWLNHPNTTTELLKEHCPNVSSDNLALARKAKNEQQVTEAIGKSALNYLKHRVLAASNREKALKLEISKLHERCRNQRRNFNHKHSTWLVRNNEIVIHEDGLQSEKMRHKAKAKPNEEGSGFDRNNTNAKSGLTKSLSDAGHGTFMAMLEQKAKTANRRFERFPARNTTRECPVCNHEQDMPASIRWYRCGNCGWECDRDQKAAILIMVKTFLKGDVAYEQLSKPVKDVLALRQRFEGRGKTKRKK